MFGTLKTLAVAGAVAASALMTTAAHAQGRIVGLVDGKTIVTIDPAIQEGHLDREHQRRRPGARHRRPPGRRHALRRHQRRQHRHHRRRLRQGDDEEQAHPSPGRRSAAITFDFNPVADRLRLMSAEGVSWRINVDDGKVTVDGSHKYKDAMAGKTPRVVAGAYTNSFKDTKATTLYNIDAATGSLVHAGAAERRRAQHGRPARHHRQRPGCVQHRVVRPGPERSLARRWAARSTRSISRPARPRWPARSPASKERSAISPG